MTTKLQAMDAVVRTCMDCEKPRKVDLDVLRVAVREILDAADRPYTMAMLMAGTKRWVEYDDHMRTLQHEITKAFPYGSFKAKVGQRYADILAEQRD